MSRRQLEATVDWILADRSAVQPLPPRLRKGETEPEAMVRWTETGHDLRYTTPEMLALERGMVATAQARAGAGVGMARADTVAAAMATRRTLTPRSANDDPGDLLQPRRRAGDRGGRRGGQDLRARGVPRGLRCLRGRGGRLCPGRTRRRAPRGGIGHRLNDRGRHAPSTSGRAPSLRRGARRRRGGHAR